MANLYLIIGEGNVLSWNENEPDEIDLNSVFHKTFDNEKEKQVFIEALYLIDNNSLHMGGSYIILDESEYRFLTT